jgi:hypothetical protein
MAIYDDRLEQHPIWAALAAAREAVDRTRDKLADPEQIEIHAHVEAVLNYLEARLNGLDAQLVSFGPIDAIYNNLQQVDASLDQFEANPGNRAILDQADTQALGVLSYLGQLPEMSSTNEVENLREVGARYRRSMGGQVGQLTGEVNALKQTVQEVSQVALQQKAEIDAQAGRLEQTLAATENAFAQAQSVRQQGFEKQVGEFETELKERLETADGSVTASVKAHGEATQQALNDLKTRATAVWEEIDGLRERAPDGVELPRHHLAGGRLQQDGGCRGEARLLAAPLCGLMLPRSYRCLRVCSRLPRLSRLHCLRFLLKGRGLDSGAHSRRLPRARGISAQ